VRWAFQYQFRPQ